MELKRVVVTGLGTINPLGNNVNEYFTNLLAGVSGAELITYFDTTLFKTKFACVVKNYDSAAFGLDRKEARKLDLYAQYALVAAGEAIQHAGLDAKSINHDRVGVIWASGIGGIQTFYDEVKGYVLGNFTPRYNPFFVPKMISDIAAGHISMKYGFRGPNYGTV